jgi:hypothetical protein
MRRLAWKLSRIWMSMNRDPLDCARRGSDNGAGISPSFAPMKIKFLKSVVLKNKQRGVVALLLFVCLTLLVLTTGTAQLRNQKRIVALQLGEAAEGSRVTVVSDSALNDYEAFRRGDRSYVKIPLADFSSAMPQLRADGFEDVQVQKVGDNVVVSFKLQPGATARVEQRSNRLDVIFSAPNRSARNNSANTTANRAASGSNTSRSTQDRGTDTAGPMPGSSELSYRQRVVTERTPDGNERRPPQNSRAPINPSIASSRNSNKGVQLNSGNSAVKSPSPVPSPTSVLSPATSHTYPPLTTASPAVSPRSNAAVNSSAPSASPSVLNWKTRWHSAVQWMSANRLATLLGALILLSLILYLVLGLRRRGRDPKAKRLKALKAQPKVQPKVQPTHSAEVEMASEFGKDRAIAAPVATAAAHHSSELTKPSIASATAGHDESSREEEEREVFEL